MRQIDSILFLSFVLIGCSATRKVPDVNTTGNSSLTFYEKISDQNITRESFFIQKAEVEIKSPDLNEKFISNIKYNRPGDYLISLRSKTGIEGARVLISGDSIKINDRINRKLYQGNSLYLKRKFGISQSLMPLIFGDFIADQNGVNNLECKGKYQELNSTVKGVMLNYKVDCSLKKSLSVTNISNNRVLIIQYSKFVIIKGKYIPEIIEVTDNQSNTKIRIRIKKIEFPWTGSLNFIPGKGYDIIELL